ncbi:MAG: ribonuclease Y [Verrucomicrobia bacterium]|nr:ribonuclease Y [Verrucomicrobiota bacterium]MDA1065400.1 ribonuclease Y [Verrucomicrobiota bacterium]
MDPNTLFLGVIGVAIGILAGWILTVRYRSNARVEAANIVELARKEASVDCKQLIAEASLQIKQERQDLTQDIQRLQAELSERERILAAKEANANDIALDLESRLEEFSVRDADLNNRGKTILETSAAYRTKLEEVAQLNPEDIRRRLEDEVRKECEDELRDMRQRLLAKSDLEVQREAQRIILTTMQRIASTPDSSNAASTVVLPNDEMKGRIIGKEGRNIKAFEALTGVTLMIDEVPGSVLISCFDPVRREAARVALELLVKDGRIHPASIEESIQKGQDEIDNLVFQYGEQAVQKLNLTGIPNEVLSLLGKLKYRYSFNQNTLDHSIECAYICSMLASELGLDPNLAKRAGLLHDIGKAVEHEYEGSHAMMAAKILRNYGENESVANAVAAHHKEVEPTSLYAPLLMIADSVSATRPGARVESLDAYAKRLVRLEAIAKDIEGVSEVFAIQAGREIRVMVAPEKVQEKDARMIALKIRNRIEEELQYPSTIKVTVIREQRFTETAT